MDISVEEYWSNLSPDDRSKIADLVIEDERAWGPDISADDFWGIADMAVRERIAKLVVREELALDLTISGADYWDRADERDRYSIVEIINEAGPIEQSACPCEFVNIALFVLNNGDDLTKIDLARLAEIGGDWNRSYEDPLNLHTSSKRK